MASKLDQFLKDSWNTFFSARKAPRRENAADRRSGGSRPEATGEDLGGGRQTFKLQDGLMSGTWLWKDLEGQEDLDPIIQHAVPGWAADRFAHSAGPNS